MPGIDDPGTPPEVPEEYAAVYREAYRRALDEAGSGRPPDAADDLVALRPVVARPGPTRFGPLLVGGLVLLAVFVVLGIRLLGDDPAPTAEVPPSPVPATTAPPTPAASATPSAPPTPSPTAAETGAETGVWAGPVAPVAVQRITATCTGEPSVDAAGEPVRYDAANAVDGDPTTAWRCDGDGIGDRLTLVLPSGTPVASLGLIPGYAKKDPVNGADRFAENNRITRVRWTLADGTTFVQDLNPAGRVVQRLRIPRTVSGTVTIEVLAVQDGTRNRTAISEIEVARAR